MSKCTSASAVARYILWKCYEARGERLSVRKLHKLLYFSQAYYLALYKEPLFADRIEAWSCGPVSPAVSKEYCEYSGGIITQEIQDPGLNPSAAEHVDGVIAGYGLLTATALENITRREPPWVAARGSTPMDEPSSAEISHLSMMNYFITQVVFEGLEGQDYREDGLSTESDVTNLPRA